MKNIILLNFFILFFLSLTPSWADYPNIPKGIDKKTFCDNKSQGGWLGFTDKYWMSALIPDSDQSINVNYRHGNSGRDSYRAGYVGKVYKISPNEDLKYGGKLFVGAKN